MKKQVVLCLAINRLYPLRKVEDVNFEVNQRAEDWETSDFESCPALSIPEKSASCYSLRKLVCMEHLLH